MTLVMAINLFACAYHDLEDVEYEHNVEETLQVENSELDMQKQTKKEEKKRETDETLSKESKDEEAINGADLEQEMLKQYTIDSPATKPQEESSKENSDSDKQNSIIEVVKVDKLSGKTENPHFQTLESEKSNQNGGLIDKAATEKQDTSDEYPSSDDIESQHIYGIGNKDMVIQGNEHDYFTDKKPKRVWNLQRQL